jgi:hypothetical protein
MSLASCHCSTPQGDYTEKEQEWQELLNLWVDLVLSASQKCCLFAVFFESAFFVMSRVHHSH